MTRDDTDPVDELIVRDLEEGVRKAMETGLLEAKYRPEYRPGTSWGPCPSCGDLHSLLGGCGVCGRD